MKPNAISLANYFIDIANRESIEIRQLGLMKRVYITHGFCLALYDLSALDPRFDKVEAWKNGPVIPSVYHSFKHNKDNPIKEKSEFTDVNVETGEISFDVPELKEEKIKAVAEFVWERYLDVDDFELVKLTHKEGTPWALAYRVGMNSTIPDSYTKAYYNKMVIR